MAAPSMSAEEVQAEMHAIPNGPAGKPPPGVMPNYQNPPNLDVFVLPTIAICLTILSFAVLVRSYTRL